MYKITLFDENCCPIASRTASFFVDDIAEFEKYWLDDPKVDKDKKERYIRSRNGEHISDYYTQSEELDIFQQDTVAEILEEKHFELTDKTFVLENAYSWLSSWYAAGAVLKFRKIKFKGRYYLTGSYRLQGVCQQSGKVYDTCTNYGNRVLRLTLPSEEKMYNANGEFCLSADKKLFAEDVAETFCWISIKESDNKDAFPFDEDYLLSEKIIKKLMMDIVGEGG